MTPTAFEDLLLEFATRCDADPGGSFDVFCADFCHRCPSSRHLELRQRCATIYDTRQRLRKRSLSLKTRSIAAGDLIDDYQIDHELGRGGMGTVYLARQQSLGRHVALKIFSPQGSRTSAHAIQRFQRESIAAARLEHPGIVRIYAVGEFDDIMYIAMEYIEGQTLDVALGHPGEKALARPGQQGHLLQVATLVAQVAEALHYAHTQGVIHRDVKPANILIDEEGNPHLLDFGLAKSVADHGITQTGDILGTPAYLSPEQTLANRIPVDERTDIFSLGVVLYELLTGRRPFDGDTLHRIIHQIALRSPASPRAINPDLHKDLETICERALRKSPDDRYDSAADMAADLRAFSNGIRIASRRPSLLNRTRCRVRRLGLLASWLSRRP